MARERGHDAQVVRDEDVGQVALVTQPRKEVDNLRLDRDIERRGRLVEHDQFRFEHDGARDGDALALTAGELVRIAVAPFRVDADGFERRDHACHALICAQFAFMNLEAFLDDLGHRHAWAERAEGVLEDDLHVARARVASA
jgi:hypothetical protein